MTFASLVSLPPGAIYALVNPIDKKVYISHTTRLPTRLGEMVDKMALGTWKFPAMTQDKSKLELVILETNTEQKYFIHYYLDQYRKQGYTVYNETENLPRGYRFSIGFDFKHSSDFGGAGVVFVTAQSTKETFVLGQFHHPDEAEDFLENVVKKNNPAGSLVYAIRK